MAALTQESVDAIFMLPRNDGRFDGQILSHLKQLGRSRPAVILAFPPKAAGTYFRTAVICAVDGQLVRAVHAQGGRDAQLYLPTFLSYYCGGLMGKPLVGHVHMQALPANIHFLEAFDIRPIAMMRSIPDMLASYWDMLESDPASRREGLNSLPPDNFLEMSREAKADFLVDMPGPWYASYFATWLGYAKRKPDRVCLLHYRDFKADPVATLRRALIHAGLPRTPEECQRALDSVWQERSQWRFNKGQRGRGADYFNADHLRRLARLLGHYPENTPHTDELLGRGAFAHAAA